MSLKILLAVAVLLAVVLLVLGFHSFSTRVTAESLTIYPPPGQSAAMRDALATQAAVLRTTPTAAATPTATPIPATATPLPTSTPTLEPPRPAAAATLNGIPLSQILVLPQAARDNLHVIAAKGQSLGRDPHAFSKVGDSTMVYPLFIGFFDDRTYYTLGPDYQYLQATIDWYPGSFAHLPATAKKSMHTWSEFDPSWANNPRCQDGEAPLDCELRINNPSVVFIRLGANDVWAPDQFDKSMRQIVQFWLSKGVIPVLGTKPDRLEGPANTLNKMVARIADDYKVPLWDYDLIAGTVPGKGLVYDHVHFKPYGSHDYTSPDAFAAADSLQDLTALMMLDDIRVELAASK